VNSPGPEVTPAAPEVFKEFPGGFALSLLCDLRVASTSARFGYPELPRGIPPSYAAARATLPATVAQELCLTGRIVDAREAQRLGIVNQVFPDASFRDDVQAVAAGIAKAPPLPVSLMKRALRVSLTNDLAANLDLISSHYGIVTATDEHKDAVRRFVAKQ
jgi:enoyl-CoA hydratase/carnithine racemase